MLSCTVFMVLFIISIYHGSLVNSFTICGDNTEIPVCCWSILADDKGTHRKWCTGVSRKDQCPLDGSLECCANFDVGPTTSD